MPPLAVCKAPLLCVRVTERTGGGMDHDSSRGSPARHCSLPPPQGQVLPRQGSAALPKATLGEAHPGSSPAWRASGTGWALAWQLKEQVGQEAGACDPGGQCPWCLSLSQPDLWPGPSRTRGQGWGDISAC